MSLPAGFDVDVPSLRALVDDLGNYEGQTGRVREVIGQASQVVGDTSWGVVGLFTKEKFTERVAQLQEFTRSAEEYLGSVDDRLRAAADIYDQLDSSAKEQLDAIAKDVESVSRGASVGNKTGDLWVEPPHGHGFFQSPHDAPGLVGEAIHGGKELVSQFKEVPDNNTEAALAATSYFMVESGTFIYECVHEVESIVENPIEYLVGFGVDFLVSVVQPLQDAIHFVSGDPNALEDGSGQFTSIGEALQELNHDFVDVSDKRLSGWGGEASLAAKKRLAEFSDGLDGLAHRAGMLAELLEASAIVMEVIEDLLKSMLTEFITWLIMLWLPALAAAVVSFGSSTAAATVATFIETGKTVADTAKKVSKLTKLLGKLVDVLKKLAINVLKAGVKGWSASARAGHGPGHARSDEQLQKSFEQKRDDADMGRAFERERADLGI